MYAYWSATSRQQQGIAQAGIAGDFGTLGPLTPGITGAIGANPADFCPPGDARCASFIQANNGQVLSLITTANVLDGTGSRSPANAANPANEASPTSGVTRGTGGSGEVIGDLLPNGTVAVRPAGAVALPAPSAAAPPAGGGTALVATGAVPVAQPAVGTAIAPVANTPAVLTGPGGANGGVGITSNIAPTTRGVAQFGPMSEPGPLPVPVANTFRSGSYAETVTTEPTVLYRAYGGTADQMGRYWTTTPPAGPVQSIVDSALNPAWGNPATSVVRIVVPPGVTLYQGQAAAQGGLVGGGNQVLFPRNITIKPSWIKP